MLPTNIAQLRKDMDSCRSDLAKIEGQQESAESEVVALEKEAKELGIEPGDLRDESIRIVDDVQVALDAVKGEVTSVTDRTNTSD